MSIFMLFHIISFSKYFIIRNPFVRIETVSYQFTQKSLRSIAGNLLSNIIKLSKYVKTYFYWNIETFWRYCNGKRIL